MHEDLYVIYGNIGYCLSGMGYYDQALSYLMHVRKITDGKRYFAWHAIAAAYCHWKLLRPDLCEAELLYAKNRPEYHKDLKASIKMYPEIAGKL